MSAIAESRRAALGEARLAQALTLVWMAAEALVAIASGVLAHSVALVAFGVDSVIELASATTVLRRLRGEAQGATTAETDGRRDRRASWLIGWALYALAAYVLISSLWTLIRGIRPDPSTPGLILAVAAVIIMPGLWRWRLALSERLHSSALRADAACSAVCLYMAVTLLVGLALNHFWNWWWADPVAGLAMIWWIRGEAAEALESARSGRHCADCATPLSGSAPS